MSAKVSKNFPCSECPSSYSHKNDLQAHIKKKHNNSEEKKILCPVCSFSATKKGLKIHFEDDHAIIFDVEQKMFDSETHFMDWKKQMESKTKSSYIFERSIRKNAPAGKTVIYKHFKCHRDGCYNPKGRGKRELKTQGSKKINAFCPSQIKIKINDTGCHMEFCKTHVGHGNELKHLFLTKDEREMLAKKIAAKIPYEEILDDVWSTFKPDLKERIHLLTRKDLDNIEQAYQLTDDGVYHANDAVSVHSWVEDVKKKENSILYYKPQGLEDRKNNIPAQDFALVVMTDAQREMLQKYGSKAIAMDGTHGMGYDGFQLVMILVFDENHEGFPAAYFVTNRVDTKMVSTFVKFVAESAGKIKTNLFMSDMENTFFNAWIKYMPRPLYRLFCTWHVDKAWRDNIKKKVKNKTDQAEVYRLLKTMQYELDETTFVKILSIVLSKWFSEPRFKSFAKYFKKKYCKRPDFWAFCYRKNMVLNTNNHLESTFKIFKHIYLKGKKIKRLDKSMYALMKLVVHKSHKNFIAEEKGTVSSKISAIRKKHKAAVKASKDINHRFQSISNVGENMWLIPSETTKDEFYEVKSNKDNKNCENCKLFCRTCNACIHDYTCSCIDYLIKYNMCKHIHFVCTKMQQETTSNDEKPLCNAVVTFVTQSESNLSTSHGIHVTPSESASFTSYGIQTARTETLEMCKKEFQEILSEVQNEEEAVLLQNCLTAARIKINAKKINFHSSSAMNDNKKKREYSNQNITKQREIFLKKTKKTREKKKKIFTTPSLAEMSQNVVKLFKKNKEKEEKEK